MRIVNAQKKKKGIKPSESAAGVALAKKPTPGEMRDLILENTKMEGDLSNEIEIYSTSLLQLKEGTPSEQKAIRNDLNEMTRAIMYGLEVETHLALMESVNRNHCGMVKELCDQIIRQYGCVTHAEKMLAETAAGAFVQHLEASKQYRVNLKHNEGGDITSTLTQFLAMLDKRQDRAYRQYTSALMMLTQMKQPRMEIKINTKTAFVGQNQQFNAVPEKL